MSDHAHPEAASEPSNPILWTIGLVGMSVLLGGWFLYNMHHGATHGRDLGKIPPPTSAGPVEPDHQKLIDSKGPEVIDQGSLVYAKNCQTCHGPQGNGNPTNMNPPPRDFWREQFKNPKGGGPYGLYTVLSQGFNGRMPAFPGMTAEDKYAVVHFIRETFVRPNNPNPFDEKDAPAVVAEIPPPGAAGGPEILPRLRPVPDDSLALMAGLAARTAPKVQSAQAWLRRAIDGSDGRMGEALVALERRHADGLIVALQQAVGKDDRKATNFLLVEQIHGVFVPELALLSTAELDQLYQQLRQAAPGSAAGVH